MSDVVTAKRMISVTPFTFEADHPRNCDLLIQSIPGCRLRSAIDGTKGIIDKNGDFRVPIDQTRQLASFPRTPGMQLEVNPAKSSYTIFDPLTEDEKMCERISRFLKERSLRTDQKIKGVPSRKGDLDVHRMKTLCRELLRIVEAGEGKIVKGPVPTIEEIEELDGHFLLNPGLDTPCNQPIFEKDFDRWYEKLRGM